MRQIRNVASWWERMLDPSDELETATDAAEAHGRGKCLMFDPLLARRIFHARSILHRAACLVRKGAYRMRNPVTNT